MREQINSMLNDGDVLPVQQELKDLGYTYGMAKAAFLEAQREIREAETQLAIAMLSPAANRLTDGRAKYLIGRQIAKALQPSGGERFKIAV
jgi:hypothetical protein